MKRPNFFIVGAPKCGTTALSEYLREHPRVFVTRPKEPHFFSRDFPYYYAPGQATLDHYLRLYEDADERHLAVGEGSVWYLYSRLAVPEILAFEPAARIVAMVRNPVEMVPSLHSQMRYMRDETEDLERAWRLQDERRRGREIPRTCRVPAFLLYGEAASLGAQVERLLEIVPAGQVRVIVFDDFRADAGAVYRETLEFLDVPDDGRQDFPRVNENKMHRAETLARITQRPPRPLVHAATAVKRTLGVRRLGVLQRLRERNRVTVQRERISPGLEREMKEYFRDDVARLGALLGRDLGHWVE